MDNLKTREIDLQLFGPQFDKATSGYLPVKSRDLFVGSTLPFSVFFPSLTEVGREVSMRLLIPAGKKLDYSVRNWLAREGIEDIYLTTDQEDTYIAYMSENVKKLIHSPDIPSEQKTMLLYDNAECIVSKVFRERPSRETIGLGQELIDNLAVHLTFDTVSSDALLGIFSKDYYTFTHSVQVAVLGMAFCNHLGWSKEQISDFGIGALFHDVGKSRVEDEILNKPGRLTKDEFEIIKKHTLLGYQQLKHTQTMTRNQLTVPLSHHESMDGTGYPQGLKGDSIHKYARIARIVDCYDALTTRRPYKEAMASSKALELMSSEMASGFDLSLLQAFVSFVSTGEGAQDNLQGTRLNLELGQEVFVKLDELGYELKLSVMGMQAGELLILRMPKGIDLRQYLCEGKTISARYTQTGITYGFTSTIMGYVHHPLPFVMLSYPKRLESHEMRQYTRNECLIRVIVRIHDVELQGVILNRSKGGCRLIVKLSDDEPSPGIGIGDSIRMEASQAGDAADLESFEGVVRNLNLAKGKALLGVQFV